MSIVALAGSPSANSRSTALLRHVLDRSVVLDTVYATDAQFTSHALHAHVAHDDVTARIERALADGPLALRSTAPLTLVA